MRVDRSRRRIHQTRPSPGNEPPLARLAVSPVAPRAVGQRGDRRAEAGARVMGILFPAVAFAAAFAGVRRSLGLGFVAVFATGYLNGVVRANFLGVFTTFMFDAALLGLYLGTFLGRPEVAKELWAGRAGKFCL